MKIGILTHYDVNNQGAQLQLYAMYKVLEAMGHTPFVLTYKKNYDFVPELEHRNQITLSSIPYILKNFLFAKGIRLTWHNVLKYTINKKFRTRNLRHCSYALADIDAAIVGADEVLSLELGVNMMMYGHGVNTQHMIAYAPSCGQTDMERIERFHCRHLMASGLSNFMELSARDERTREIIQCLTQREVPVVCDPALLYEFPLEEYKLPRRTPKRDYVVVYSYDARFTSPDEIDSIRRYAHKNRLKTVSVGTYHGWCDYNIACNALEWLKCIAGAKAVITDTFHGTIAAAITERPIAIHYSKSVNSSKMLDLINRLGLNDRLLKDISIDEVERIFSQPQDMVRLRERIQSLRKESRDYLCRALNRIICQEI
ncbi:MAG: polysaccharide pyruvyl transferase family protein [Alistipes sp.]|nr:polysaccharide pyruvyl transferase family protein [Alistipes sp.]